MEHKVILITGASSGIGHETALQLIKEGNIVYGAARRTDRMQDLKSASGHVLTMDMTDDQSMVEGVKKVIEEQGKIDVLINNAGYAIYGAVEDIKIEDARREFEVNLFGLGRLTQLVLPHMREAKSGKIINISSMGGKMYTPLGAWYHAAKHAVEGWSDCLRLETKQFGIQVVVIEPGAIATEFGDVMTAPMIETSGKGPYAKLVDSLVAASKKSYEKGGSSPASVIARVISKAVRARKPRTRYAKGKYAKPMLFIRRYFSDRFFDRVIMSQVK